jgi:hypothetical protein
MKMTATVALAHETIWFEKYKFDEAERQYHEKSIEACVTEVPKELKKPESEKNGNNGVVAEEDDIDLFGSDDDEEDAEKERLKEERLKAYQDKKVKEARSDSQIERNS